MSEVYLSQRIEKDRIAEISEEFATLQESVRWATRQRDGTYESGSKSPWGGVDYSTDSYMIFNIKAGEILPPERTDWERLGHGSDLAVRLAGRPVPKRTTLHVLIPGDLSSQGCFRDPGLCLARGVNCGDKVLDVLEVEFDWETLRVFSQRQSEAQYDWTPDGPRFNRERRTVAQVKISGRAAQWGTLGDDSYDPDSADHVLNKTLIEAVLGLGEWTLAPVYYESREVPEDQVMSRDPIYTVELAQHPVPEQFQARRLAALSLADDTRPQTILRGQST